LANIQCLASNARKLSGKLSLCWMKKNLSVTIVWHNTIAYRKFYCIIFVNISCVIMTVITITIVPTYLPTNFILLLFIILLIIIYNLYKLWFIIILLKNIMFIKQLYIVVEIMLITVITYNKRMKYTAQDTDNNKIWMT